MMQAIRICVSDIFGRMDLKSYGKLWWSIEVVSIDCTHAADDRNFKNIWRRGLSRFLKKI